MAFSAGSSGAGDNTVTKAMITPNSSSRDVASKGYVSLTSRDLRFMME